MKSEKLDIIVVGAGAAGLMAARELARAGKKVIILEARNRVGGRIEPLDQTKFGYPAEGGAEFVHGAAPITKALAAEAGLTFLPIIDGEMWRVENGELVPGGYDAISNDQNSSDHTALHEALKNLKEDMPLTTFLEKYFAGDQYTALRERIIRTAEGYDAADAQRASTFALRDEWLDAGDWEQGKIKEGYGDLIEFLANDCAKHGVEIVFGKKVERIETDVQVKISCADGTPYESSKALITLPLPLISDLQFVPALPKKVAAASGIGFGDAIKIVLSFNEMWWVHADGRDLSKMSFLFSQETVPLWWTQYPDSIAALTGWIAGPATEKFAGKTDQEILDRALESLAKNFKMSKDEIRAKRTAAAVVNWATDPFARGAYSYPSFGAAQARAELQQSASDKIFFAGEALYSGKDTGTVESALGSGKETAEAILKI